MTDSYSITSYVYEEGDLVPTNCLDTALNAALNDAIHILDGFRISMISMQAAYSSSNTDVA